MAAILQTTFSCVFSWMKNFVLWFKCHWSLFLGVQLAIIQHWFRYWLGAEQAIAWTNTDTVHWRIYATLGGDKLMASNSLKETTVEKFNICADKSTKVKFKPRHKKNISWKKNNTTIYPRSLTPFLTYHLHICGLCFEKGYAPLKHPIEYCGM